MAVAELILPTDDGARDRKRRLLRGWCIASLLWLLVVGVGFVARVHEQVDATRAIGRELQMMNCEAAVPAKCEAEGLADYEGSWGDTATLFATFGFWALFGWAVVPPCGVLVLGGALAWLGRSRLERSPGASTR
jgi:hypothetical protein